MKREAPLNAKILYSISKYNQAQVDALISTDLLNACNMVCVLNRRQVVMDLTGEIIRNAGMASFGFEDSREIINITNKELIKIARLEGFDDCEICAVESLIMKCIPNLYFRFS